MRPLMVVMSLFLSAHALGAEDLDDAGSMVALQNREFRLRHELTVAAGMLPLDAFYKGFTGQVSYAYHFNDFLAWQVGRASFSYNARTNLGDQLSRDYGVTNAPNPQVKWMAGSDLIWSPAYGKIALMNAEVVHLQLFLLGGGSAVSTGATVAPAADIGGGLRLFLSQNLSLRLDVANNFVFAKHPFNVLAINLGLAFNLGGQD